MSDEEKYKQEFDRYANSALFNTSIECHEIPTSSKCSPFRPILLGQVTGGAGPKSDSMIYWRKL